MTSEKVFRFAAAYGAGPRRLSEIASRYIEGQDWVGRDWTDLRRDVVRVEAEAMFRSARYIFDYSHVNCRCAVEPISAGELEDAERESRNQQRKKRRRLLETADTGEDDGLSPAWVCADGTAVRVCDMETSHLISCLSIVRKRGRWRAQYAAALEAELGARGLDPDQWGL